MEQDERDLALKLIATDHLRPEGILENGTKYWGAFVNGELIGLIGCEYENQYGLLRSAIVAKDFRGQGIGKQLTRFLLNDAEQKKLDAIYLFSTGAGQYWRSFGFEESWVAEVVEKLANAPQVKLFNELGWLPTEAAYKLYLS
jgi:N-acetylglutamate synthase-like GNAT family acetyltransferase